RRFENTSGCRLRVAFPGELQPTSPGSGVEIASELLLIGRLPIYSPRGEVVAIVELLSDRELNVQAVRTIRSFLLFLASAAGILFFLVWYLFDANFILPVRKLGDQLEVATR